MILFKRLPPAICLAVFTLSLISGITENYADKIITIDDGQKVILKDDGTWKYITNPRETETLKKAPYQENEDNTPAIPTSKDISTIVDELKTASPSDFKNTRWGMSEEQVKRIERLKLIEEGKDFLKYDYTLIGMNCNVIYYFTDGKLSSARYTMKQKHHDPALFSEDFIALKKHLLLLYGPCVSFKDIWQDDQFKTDESKWGFAVSLGFLTRLVTWKNGETEIVLRMAGQNHEIFINIEYAIVF
jgi:hypothetical protein